MKRFAIEIRWRDSHKLVAIESGYATREAAQAIADARQRTINNNGWNQYAHVTEAHRVGDA